MAHNKTTDLSGRARAAMSRSFIVTIQLGKFVCTFIVLQDPTNDRGGNFSFGLSSNSMAAGSSTMAKVVKALQVSSN
jgi:hypothetical protein